MCSRLMIRALSDIYFHSFTQIKTAIIFSCNVVIMFFGKINLKRQFLCGKYVRLNCEVHADEDC